MNKHLFIVLSLVLLFFFACDLQIPTAVEIRGTPELAFPAPENMNISKKFSDVLSEGIDKANEGKNEKEELIYCTNTAIQTYIAYMHLFDEVITDEVIKALPGATIPNVPVPILADIDLFYEHNIPTISIPLDGFHDNSTGFDLTGFELSGAKFIFYAYSDKPEFLDLLSIEVTVNNGTEELIENIKSIKNGKSARANWTGKVYPGTSIPNDGNVIDLPLSCAKTDIKFRIFIPKDTIITADQADALTNINISGEAVFWIPFELEAGPDGGALIFPDNLFPSGYDLFSRENADSENLIFDIVESLELIFRLNSPAFSGAELVVTNQQIEIRNTLSGDSLNFPIDEEKMALINDPANYPFAPKFKLEFSEGGKLMLPNGLEVKELAFKAKIKYRVDL